MIEESVNAQTEKITRLQTSVSKNAQDIDKNKIEYFSIGPGLNSNGNDDNKGAKSPHSIAIGPRAVATGGGRFSIYWIYFKFFTSRSNSHRCLF